MNGLARRTTTGMLRIALLAVIAAASLWATELARPLGAYACSCMQPDDNAIGKFADQPEIVVFVGTVIRIGQGMNDRGHTFGTLAVDQVFKGRLPAREMPVIGGGGGDCTIGIELGQRMITAARFADGALTPGLCMPYGDPATPEGQRLIAVATLAYGPGVAPPGGPPTAIDPPAAPTSGTGDLALPVILGSVLVVAVMLFGGLALLARRGRAPA